jgi:hypothetical protein
MQYPEYMTPEDIEQFEYELNRIIDMERGEGFWTVNAELSLLAAEQAAEAAVDRALESLYN